MNVVTNKSTKPLNYLPQHPYQSGEISLLTTVLNNQHMNFFIMVNGTIMSQTQVLLTKIAKLCTEVHAIKGAGKINNIQNKLSGSKNKYTTVELDISVRGDPHAPEHKYNTTNYPEAQSYSPYKSHDNEEPHTQSQLTQRLCWSAPTQTLSLLPSEMLTNSSRLSASSRTAEISVMGNDGNSTSLSRVGATELRKSQTSSGAEIELDSVMEGEEQTCPSSCGLTMNKYSDDCEGSGTGTMTSD